MANSRKKVETDDIKVIENEDVEETIEENTEKIVEEDVKEVEKPKKKNFNKEDLISCVSITPGKMFYCGNKSGKLYTFADIDDVVDIEFGDLDYAARTKDAMMYRPRFIVQNADFVALHPALDSVYSSLHSSKELKDILKMTPTQIEKKISLLPEGAKEAIKCIAITMIENGTLDSIQRIKVLDSIFDTEMLLKLNSME